MTGINENRRPHFAWEWTTRRLDVLAEYLSSYTTALKHAPFEKWYVDGFAGSSPGARPMDPTRAMNLSDQCQRAGVPFFFRRSGRTNEKQAGRALNGRPWSEMPLRGARCDPKVTAK